MRPGVLPAALVLVAQSGEGAVLIVRPDQAQLYECAVRAFGADRVLYDRRQGATP